MFPYIIGRGTWKFRTETCDWSKFSTEACHFVISRNSHGGQGESSEFILSPKASGNMKKYEGNVKKKEQI